MLRKTYRKFIEKPSDLWGLIFCPLLQTWGFWVLPFPGKRPYYKPTARRYFERLAYSIFYVPLWGIKNFKTFRLYTDLMFSLSRWVCVVSRSHRWRLSSNLGTNLCLVTDWLWCYLLIIRKTRRYIQYWPKQTSHPGKVCS